MEYGMMAGTKAQPAAGPEDAVAKTTEPVGATV
jgi:hypothetical protein